ARSPRRQLIRSQRVEKFLRFALAVVAEGSFGERTEGFAGFVGAMQTDERDRSVVTCLRSEAATWERGKVFVPRDESVSGIRCAEVAFVRSLVKSVLAITRVGARG